jgi:pyrroline-5-carboxylate reductase
VAGDTQFAVGLIGVGNMGAALVRGIIEKGTMTAESVIVCDLDRDLVSRVCKDLGVVDGTEATHVARSADLVILAAKPQNLPSLLKQISPSINANQTIMSIAAGVTTHSIEKGLGGQPSVIRVMPNLPALVGEGISVICGGSYATEPDFERVEQVLNAVGVCIKAKEQMMDPVTALSGTGPAYVFHTMEAMIRSGIDMGMSPEMAERLVIHTVFGAAMLAMKSDLDPTSLREAVTSRGGTTDAAISHLEENGYSRLVVEAILAAMDRSEELGRGS